MTRGDSARRPRGASRAQRSRRSWGRGGPSFGAVRLKWAFTWVIIPLGTLAILVGGAVELGPALAAAQGHGTVGVFVAENENCNKDGCGWTGDFVTHGDRVTRLNVIFLGPHGTLAKGAELPAIDSGAPGEVFARHGSRTWAGDLAAVIGGAAGIAVWAWWVPYRRLRRRARRDAFLTQHV